jgi:primosomal protein N' (replication factor Y) (superfamily II helicase)
MFAEVIIDIKHHDVNHMYDYKIPEHLKSILEVGMRVWVPFGHLKRTGIIMHLKMTSEDATKTIIDIDTVMPVFNQKELSDIKHLVKNNHMLYQHAIELMMPHIFHLKYRYEMVVKKRDDFLEELKMTDVNKTYTLLKKDEIHLSKLKTRQQKGIIELTQKPISYYPKRHTQQYLYTGKKYGRLQTQCDRLNMNTTYQKPVLLEMGFSNSNIQTLLKHDVFQRQDPPQSQKHRHAIKKTNHPIDVVILPYEKMIEDVLKKITLAIKNNEHMLILVPSTTMLKVIQQDTNIALTYDYKTTSKALVSLIQIFSDAPQIVISTRKGIFLPVIFDRIYIIESHSKTYRFDQGVFFDTMETLSYLQPHANIHVHSYAPFPSVLSLIDHEKLELHNPSVIDHQLHLISMKDELISGHTKVLSREVIEATLKALKKKHVLMYYPKKGYQTVNVCRLCGEVQLCPHCNAKLKVNAAQQAYCMTCHHNFELNHTCSNHHQKMMKPLGLGLEFVAKNIQNLFTDVDVYVIDKEHDDRLMTHQPSIFIGTQKIQSYLHLLDVELVVIVLADLSFHVIDILDDERHMLDLITLTPHAHHTIKHTYIQTYDQNHPMIQGLYHPLKYMKDLTKERELLLLPPYGLLFEIDVHHDSFFKGYQETLKIQDVLNNMNIQAIGPVYEEIQPFKLIIKIKKDQIQQFYDFVSSHHLQSRRIQ